MRFSGPLLLASAILTAPLLAQTPPSPASDWLRVQAIKPGTEVRISSRLTALGYGFPLIIPRHSRVSCAFVAATDTEISCTRTNKIFFVPLHTSVRIPRDKVTAVRLTREQASTFTGGLIGAGAGVAAGAGLTATEADHSEDVLVYLLLGLLGSLIGGIIGKATDFLGGPTVYRAP